MLLDNLKVMMDLADIASNICCNVGREFPDQLDQRSEMVLRQLSSLVEEAIELDESMTICLSAIGDTGPYASEINILGFECCNTILTAYMVAHYASIDLQSAVDFLDAASSRAYELPYRAAGLAMKSGRRYLGIARRGGTKDQLAGDLARVVLSVRHLADCFGVELDTSIHRKVEIIFSRGWRGDSGDRSSEVIS